MIKLLIGGSPCTFWSIVKKTYENNKSTAQAIKDEISKYAMQIAMSNYPDIIQHGDAFQVRDKNWEIKKGVKK